MKSPVSGSPVNLPRGAGSIGGPSERSPLQVRKCSSHWAVRTVQPLCPAWHAPRGARPRRSPTRSHHRLACGTLALAGDARMFSLACSHSLKFKSAAWLAGCWLAAGCAVFARLNARFLFLSALAAAPTESRCSTTMTGERELSAYSRPGEPANHGGTSGSSSGGKC